jgi:PAS domain S-box-containing protein
MDPQYSDDLRMPEFGDLRSLWIWMPVLTVVGLYVVTEGLIHFLELSEEMDLTADVLIVLVTMVGGYFGSTSIAKVLRRREVQADLRKQWALAGLERRYHLLNETSTDGFLLLGADGICLYASPSIHRLLGYTSEGLLGRGGFEQVHPDDRQIAMDRFAESLQRPGQALRAEFRIRHRDGSWRWIDSTIRNLLADPSVRAIVANYHDITEPREAEEAQREAQGELKARVLALTEELTSLTAAFEGALAESQRANEEFRSSQEQMRASAGRLLTLHEVERARLARDVHEELGQTLAALKFEVARLITRRPDDEASRLESAHAISVLADTAIGSVRQISADLRPSILDDLGLASALEWLAQEFESHTGVAAEFVQGQMDRHLPSDVRTAVFRISQEILSNVTRHAHATRVRIHVREEAGNLLLTAADNGRGITEAEITRPTSLGLFGMRERALLVGGQISIVGRAGEGTTVTLQIPLHHPVSKMPTEGHS